MMKRVAVAALLAVVAGDARERVASPSSPPAKVALATTARYCGCRGRG